jgi:uncharacterized protein
MQGFRANPLLEVAVKIDINRALVSKGEVFDARYDGAFAQVEFLGQQYEFADGAYVQVSYFLDNDDIAVTGSFEARANVVCAKCLKEFEYPVSFHFTEYYKKSRQDADYTYAGHSIDLTQMLQDNFVLSLPSRHVCSEMCKGLCVSCGADMNNSPCDCKSEIDKSNPFYGLTELIDD